VNDTSTNCSETPNQGLNADRATALPLRRPVNPISLGVMEALDALFALSWHGNRSSAQDSTRAAPKGLFRPYRNRCGQVEGGMTKQPMRRMAFPAFILLVVSSESGVVPAEATDRHVWRRRKEPLRATAGHRRR